MGLIYDTYFNVLSLLDDVVDRMYKKSYIDYILIMARGDVTPNLKRMGKDPYVIDYQVDNYYDETREKFYVKYMDKRYRSEGFKYEGEDGFFDLNVEMMIYSHVWESYYILKLLAHIADLLSGKPYDWELKVPFNKNKEFIYNRIIAPLAEGGEMLGTYLKNAYSPNLRNAFAHSMYLVDHEQRRIVLHNLKFDPDDNVQNVITFEDFQKKFMDTIQLSYYLSWVVARTREDIAKECKGAAVTVPFELPNKRKMQVFVDYKEIRGKIYPVFRATLIKETVKRFNVGDWVCFESLKTPIEIEDVVNTETEQFVKLKGCRRKCSSNMLTLSVKPNIIDSNCSDYKIIKIYLS